MRTDEDPIKGARSSFRRTRLANNQMTASKWIIWMPTGCIGLYSEHAAALRRLKRMEKRELVLGTRNPKAERTVIVTLAPKGQARVEVTFYR